MSESLAITYLREAVREASKKRAKFKHLVLLRRYLVAIADILEIFLNFQRDRKYDWYNDW